MQKCTHLFTSGNVFTPSGPETNLRSFDGGLRRWELEELLAVEKANVSPFVLEDGEDDALEELPEYGDVEVEFRESCLRRSFVDDVVSCADVRENGRERFLKLDFGAKRPSAEIIKIVSQLMFEAAVQAQIPVRSADIVYVDVARGYRHKGARMGSRVRTEINASCANISAMWPAI